MLSFGTSGLRGLVKDMTDKECFINAKGFLGYLLGKKAIAPGSRVCLAGDLRSSTDRIMRAVAQAVLSAGCQVENCGKIPSPAVLYHAMRQGRASIMTTGSHIPDDRNGLKFNQPQGEILKSDEPGILAAISRVRAEENRSSSAESLFQPDETLKTQWSDPLPAVGPEAGQAYLERYQDLFPENALAGKTIVVDQHSAVGRDYLVRILQGVGATVLAVGRTDAFVAKDTENVTAEMADGFRKLARQHQPFAIVSTDGDSDRPFVIDETGCFHPGDVLGAVVAAFLKARCAAVPVSANDAVVGFLGQKGIRLRQTRIGSPYVVAAMQAAETEGLGPSVGWEANGGFMTASTFILNQKPLTALPSRDAVLPILCALMAGREAGGMNRLFQTLPRRFTQSGLIDAFPTEVSQCLLRGFQPEAEALRADFEDPAAMIFYKDGRSQQHPAGVEAFQEGFWKSVPSYAQVKAALAYYFRPDLGFAAIKAMDWTDGVRIFFANRDIAHIRPSGNAPQLRIYANADSQERADEIVRQGIADNGLLRNMEADITRPH